MQLVTDWKIINLSLTVAILKSLVFGRVYTCND